MAYQPMPAKPAQGADWSAMGNALVDNVTQLVADVKALHGAGPSTTTNYSVYDGFTAPWAAATEPEPYVLGTRFTVAQAGQITKLRYYLVTRAYDGTTIELGLFTDAGESVATTSLSITSAMAIGWVDVTLAAPVNVSAGAVYKVVCTAPLVGGFSQVGQADAGWTAFSNTGPGLTASQAGGNGWYNYDSSTLAAPNTVSNWDNAFGVDVVLAVTGGGSQQVVATYYSDATAGTAGRPTTDNKITVLWINTTGTVMPTNALAGVDKVLTA